MKTQQLPMMYSLKKIIITSMMLMGANLNSFSQKTILSFELGRDLSGNGLGGNVCPALAVTNQKFTLSIGPNFQRKKMNISGIQTNFRYAVAKNYSEKIELFFSGNITYHSNAMMSARYVDIEQSSNPEQTIDFGALRYRVIESYAGVGLKINPIKQLGAYFNLGIGGFNTLDNNYNREMYREKAACALQLRMALIYSFTK
jgi:hypothetical protein